MTERIGSRKGPKEKGARKVIKEGDFVLIDLTGTVRETDETFDTTDEERAKKAGIYREGTTYEPRLVVVGDGWVLKGIDRRLVGLEVNKSYRIVLKPEEAFGPRDPKKIEVVPYRMLRAEGVTPRPGLSVRYKGREAVVRSISGGRVQLDYNPPLAGRVLVYDLSIRRVLRDPKEKIAALIHRWLPSVNAKAFTIRIRGDKVRIVIPKEAFYVDGLQVIKRGIFKDIEKYFPEVTRVDFIETYAREA